MAAIGALNRGLHSLDERLHEIEKNALFVARETAAIRKLLGGAIALWVVLLVLGAIALAGL